MFPRKFSYLILFILLIPITYVGYGQFIMPKNAEVLMNEHQNALDFDITAENRINSSSFWTNFNNQTLLYSDHNLTSVNYKVSNIEDVEPTIIELQNETSNYKDTFFRIAGSTTGLACAQELAINFTLTKPSYINSIEYIISVISINILNYVDLNIRSDDASNPSKVSNIFTSSLLSAVVSGENFTVGDTINATNSAYNLSYFAYSQNQYRKVYTTVNQIFDPGTYWFVFNGTKDISSGNIIHVQTYQRSNFDFTTMNRTGFNGYPNNDFSTMNYMVDKYDNGTTLASIENISNYNMYCVLNYTNLSPSVTDREIDLFVDQSSDRVDETGIASFSNLNIPNTCNLNYTSNKPIAFDIAANFTFQNTSTPSLPATYTYRPTTNDYLWTVTVPIANNITGFTTTGKSMTITPPNGWTLDAANCSLSDLPLTATHVQINYTSANTLIVTVPSEVIYLSPLAFTLNTGWEHWEWTFTNGTQTMSAYDTLTIPLDATWHNGTYELRIAANTSTGKTGYWNGTITIVPIPPPAPVPISLQIKDTAGRVIPNIQVELANQTWSDIQQTTASGNVSWASITYDQYNVTYNDTMWQIEVNATSQSFILTLPYQWIFNLTIMFQIIPSEYEGDLFAGASYILINATRLDLNNLQGQIVLGEGMYTLTVYNTSNGVLYNTTFTVALNGNTQITINSDFTISNTTTPTTTTTTTTTTTDKTPTDSTSDTASGTPTVDGYSVIVLLGILALGVGIRLRRPRS